VRPLSAVDCVCWIAFSTVVGDNYLDRSTTIILTG
jgi:hypothetical protein